MTRTVLKFGGTSVASPTALENVARIVAGLAGDRIVVVSATAGTTDGLYLAARKAQEGDGASAEEVLRDIAAAHANLVADLLGMGGGETLKEIGDLTERTVGLLRSVAMLRECTARTLDAIVTYGEHVSAPIVAALFKARGVNAEALSAQGLVITDDAFGHASPLADETRARAQSELIPRLKAGIVPAQLGAEHALQGGPQRRGRIRGHDQTDGIL